MPRFNYTRLLRNHIGSSQEIRCSTCGTVFPYEQLDALRLYDMACPKCKKGIVEERTLAGAYANELQAIDPEMRLPEHNSLFCPLCAGMTMDCDLKRLAPKLTPLIRQ